MARFAQTEIERLKREISVQRLIEHSGIALKKAGKDLIGCCPFHEDATASLVVTPVKNLWHCFGCGAAGGSIDWVMRKNGISFRHAVELLREGTTVSSLVADGALPSAPIKKSTVPMLAAPITLNADDQALLNQVVGYYHETLLASPEALAYLESRGLTGQATMQAITTFKLGFANRTLGLRLPQKNRVAGADIRTRLQRIGIYRDSGHEHFNGSLTIPVLDAAGNIVEIYGRKLLDNLRAGTPKHLYLPSEHRANGRGVFNLVALTVHQEIILCEALIDALTFWVAGYRNVTASYGIEGFTDDLLAAFKQHGTQRVLIAYDRDEAGERGAQKVAAQLMAAGIDCFRVQFPKGMDANDYALKVTPAVKSLGVVIRKALWLGQGKGQAPERPETEPVYTALPDIIKTAPVPQKLPEPLPTAAQQPITEAEPLLVLPASPMPDAPAPALDAQVTDNEITLTVGNRRYRIRGLQKNLAFEVLKVNVLVSDGTAFHVDSLDLYSARPSILCLRLVSPI
jgi:DNA primase